LTFRLADSVPRAVIERWREEIRLNAMWSTEEDRHRELQRRLARYEDAGWGECHLKRPEIAALVRDALVRFDGERYRLLEWCIMPNHVHVLIEQVRGFALADIIKSWKVFTAREANAILGRTGRFWMREYFDRRIRDAKHRNQAAAYIRNNPVKAGLCERPEDWPWSSATVSGGEE
jgi:REP element-mobilizing transposase RayT